MDICRFGRIEKLIENQCIRLDQMEKKLEELNQKLGAVEKTSGEIYMNQREKDVPTQTETP